MKIREYEEDTQRLCDLFNQEKAKSQPDDFKLIDLYERWEARVENVMMWRSQGLTLDDDVPSPTMHVIMPTFDTCR